MQFPNLISIFVLFSKESGNIVILNSLLKIGFFIIYLYYFFELYSYNYLYIFKIFRFKFYFLPKLDNKYGILYIFAFNIYANI